MAKKIEGFVPMNQDRFFGHKHKASPIVIHEMAELGTRHHHATVVLHDNGPERVFTESEVRAMFQVLRSNEFFEDGGATLMHIDDFNARVQTFFSDPA